MSSVSTTITSTTTAITKSQEQVLIQSGAMIAVIVIGFIIILAIILIIMKTYNRTHTSRILGVRSGTKPRPKLSQSTAQSTMPLSPLGVSSISGSITNSNPGSESSFRLPRVELPSMEENRMEQFSTTSDSTVVTIHEPTSPANT
uniref:Noncompact myelin-associated protein n=3 Tax=Oryzias latipes TaxID=8090 RepID=A0A3P9HUG9_ORYLA